MPHPSRSAQAVPSPSGAQPAPKCTCTALCGDDPGIRDAKVTPCAYFVEFLRARFARNAAPARQGGQDVQMKQLLKLADDVSRLNPEAGEIGAGMLVQLVTNAKRALGEVL